MNVPDALLDQARSLLEHLRSEGLKLSVAESCTGGLICAVLTEIAGASDVFDRGFVAYSYAAKTDLLGVPRELVEQHGAVTGIAGPGGSTPDKPVGLVHFAAARRGRAAHAERRLLTGDRTAVRLASAAVALELLRQ